MRVSPVSGFKSGSMDTLGQVSLSNCAVKYLISLCLRAGKPTLVQLRVCPTVKMSPQTHSAAKCEGRHPHRKQIASLKASL